MTLRTAIAIFIILAASVGGQPAAAELTIAGDVRPDGDAVKAAYLFNFIKFIEWPENQFPAKGEAIKVGVLGRESFWEALAPIEKRMIRGRPLRILFNPSVQELAGCQVVFIGSTHYDYLAEHLQTLTAQSVLTVSDSEGFAALGGIIGFVVRDNRIGLEVNVATAESAQLRISAKLLEMAKIIN